MFVRWCCGGSGNEEDGGSENEEGDFSNDDRFHGGVGLKKLEEVVGCSRAY